LTEQSLYDRDIMEPAKICIHRMRISYENVDLSPDQNLLVPAIMATAIQLICSYFCVRL